MIPLSVLCRSFRCNPPRWRLRSQHDFLRSAHPCIIAYSSLSKQGQSLLSAGYLPSTASLCQLTTAELIALYTLSAAVRGHVNCRELLANHPRHGRSIGTSKRSARFLRAPCNISKHRTPAVKHTAHCCFVPPLLPPSFAAAAQAGSLLLLLVLAISSARADPVYCEWL